LQLDPWHAFTTSSTSTKQNKTKQNKTKMKKNHKNNSIHYLTRNTNKHQQARQKKSLFFIRKDEFH